MKQARVGLLVAALVAMALTAALPLTAEAQPAAAKPGDKPAAEGDKPAEGEQPAAAEGDQPAEGEGDQPAEGEQPAEGAAPTEGGLGDICQIDPTACPTVNMEEAAKRPLEPEIYAVQQIYALREGRFEINPYYGQTMNDQFVSHPAFGLAVNYYLTNVIGVGINGNIYGNSQSEFNFQTSRAARIGQPITEYQWNANANFTYVPAYGKFAGFSDFIFHYDFYVVGGVGAISTRPVAVVDPDNRTFDFEPKIAFNVGGGLRIFFNRWFAVMAEVRDYIFFDDLENPAIAEGVNAEGIPNAQDPTTWLSPDSSFTNNVAAQLGISIFLPFSWEYRLPK
jgi:outer membrane beta-barrel protein